MQKHSERSKYEGAPPSRKRNYQEASKPFERKDAESKHKIEEVDISAPAQPQQPGVISLSKKNNNLRTNKRQKTEEGEEEVEEVEEDPNKEGDEEDPGKEGYKGKHKKGHFNPMMGYVPPYYMMDYPPMYPMDPYMMNPYSWKPKKNKSWVKK
mmetsp:Transcript_15235/g.17670  ORF Transcript_15235/g.17670 Transcript_15235/m.17670 type:complete len:153 (-) Transcript_15235:10-468(-)